MHFVEINQNQIVEIMNTFDEIKRERDKDEHKEHYEGVMIGIRFVLDKLQIFIDGVNYDANKKQDDAK